MLIEKIIVENFRSFKELCIELNDFNVFIGPNAAGKSNFLQIFRFVRDIINLGLANAISMQGGIEYLRNLHIGKSIGETRFRFEITRFTTSTGKKEICNRTIILKPVKLIFDFTIKYSSNADEYFIKYDILSQEFDFIEKYQNEEKYIGKGIIEFKQENAKIKRNFINNTEIDFSIEDIVPTLFEDTKLSIGKHIKNIFLENLYYMPHLESVRKELGQLSVYDLDPLQGRSVSTITGKMQLEDNGENIAIVLKRILKDKETTRQLFNYLKHILPFIEEIEIEKFLDKHLYVKIKEKYTPNEFISASLLSSGTITLIAIIIALFFEDKKISIFEEPAGRVHPYLIGIIIEMMKDASNNTQILLTTHNPEIVKYAGLENIFCLTRDNESFSVISHISKKEEITTFLENEIGLEELFVQNLLSK